ncbi:autoinducer binding domain-containing protein [Roseivivax sp. CAU 1761]
MRDLIDLSTLPQPETQLREFIDQVCAKHEFSFAAYAGTNPVARTIHGVVNYPDSWKMHYAQAGLHEVDPTLAVARRSVAPVDWARLRGTPQFDRVFSDAHDFGIPQQGLTIPVRGPFGDVGLFSVTRDCPDEEWGLLKRKVLGELQTLAVHLHDTVINTHDLTRTLTQPALSNREVEILQWIAAGKSQQDVADILSISHRTVEVHLRSSREKLGALTTAQAVGRAIGMRLVYPD